MDYGKSMGAPSTNQASAPPVYQGNFAHPPPYSAQPQGYGFSQQYVPSVDQQLNQQHVQQHVSLESALQGSPVNDYFGYSIFTMVCCFFPLGTRDAIARGDRQMAEWSSRRALIMNHSALGIGIGMFSLSITMIVILFVI
ncbi:synapse differentiation-inducing gene protein 1-like isoform X2 [Poeciliopsis prolifica]|uniref:synapse differentiation-inducing gene protein 1-like isoform X2 n=1 Tax=Poeciliopsis prolifica TaxID=188132 RepID=UPI0024138934|nr:synapse differentiation-inducing gene protein 1-like isoform X2 [Poeciliopsis prolifica]